MRITRGDYAITIDTLKELQRRLDVTATRFNENGWMVLDIDHITEILAAEKIKDYPKK